MKRLFLGLLFLSSISNAFINPTHITCKNSEEVRLLGDGVKKKTYYKKDFNALLKQTAVIEISKGRKVVAKLYPQDGLDHVLLDKKYFVQTDTKSYWSLASSESSKEILKCELIHE